MSSQIKDLISMGDVETLYELMGEDDDWMNQLDAAEGLVKLGDVRGLYFLVSAEESDDKQIRRVAKEILNSPAVLARRRQLEADDRRSLQNKVESAKKRLDQGGKVFRYKMVYLPAGDILDEDPSGDGFDVPALTEHGLEGWEVVTVIPRRKQTLVNVVDENYSGAYFLMKKEVSSEESSDLDNI